MQAEPSRIRQVARECGEDLMQYHLGFMDAGWPEEQSLGLVKEVLGQLLDMYFSAPPDLAELDQLPPLG
jgi:hypothetical protein